MQIGMVGLGRTGGDMARRLMRGGHEVVAWLMVPAGAATEQVVTDLALRMDPVAS